MFRTLKEAEACRRQTSPAGTLSQRLNALDNVTWATRKHTAQNGQMRVLTTPGTMSDTPTRSGREQATRTRLPFLSVSDSLSRNQSLVQRRAEWMWAPSLQTSAVTCHFHLLAHSCAQSSCAFKQRWHLKCVKMIIAAAPEPKKPIPLCFYGTSPSFNILTADFAVCFCNTRSRWKLFTGIRGHMEKLLLTCLPPHPTHTHTLPSASIYLTRRSSMKSP